VPEHPTHTPDSMKFVCCQITNHIFESSSKSTKDFFRMILKINYFTMQAFEIIGFVFYSLICYEFFSSPANSSAVHIHPLAAHWQVNTRHFCPAHTIYKSRCSIFKGTNLQLSKKLGRPSMGLSESKPPVTLLCKHVRLLDECWESDPYLKCRKHGKFLYDCTNCKR
jgi:hypothetical protein